MAELALNIIAFLQFGPAVGLAGAVILLVAFVPTIILRKIVPLMHLKLEHVRLLVNLLRVLLDFNGLFLGCEDI